VAPNGREGGRGVTYQFTVLPHIEFTVLVYSGTVTKADFDTVWAEMVETSGYEPYFDELVVLAPDADFSGIKYEISIEESRRYAKVARSRPVRAKRSAFVCATDMQVYMARMFIAFVRVSGLTGTEIECFRELGPTLDWIEGSGAPRAPARADIVRVLKQFGQAWCLEQTTAYLG
jgi:hypothetical protein